MLRVMTWAERLALLRVMCCWQVGLSVTSRLPSALLCSSLMLCCYNAPKLCVRPFAGCAGLLMLRVMSWAERLALLRVMRCWHVGLAVALACLATHLGSPGGHAATSWRCMGADASAAALQPQASPLLKSCAPAAQACSTQLALCDVSNGHAL